MKKHIGFENFCENLPEFDNHNSVLFVNNKKIGLRGFIAFHRGGFSRPCFGATRFLEYENDTEALRDALRLARLMSYKNALAGLPYGGAKTVLIKTNKNKSKKKILLSQYVRYLNRLNGSFITGTDMGLDLKDLKVMFENTPFVVGNVNNPEKATALGLFYSIQKIGKHFPKKKDLKDMSFAIQGVGKVGLELLNLIYPYSSEIYVSDINKNLLKDVKKKYPKVVILDKDKIISQEVDVFSPCATGNVLNIRSINKIRANAIIGSANNQLKSIEVAKLLHRLGILYCPDYVVNAGGLIAVADEFQFKKPSQVRLNEKLKLIGVRLDKILTLSKKKNKSPAIIADEMAEQIFNKEN